MAMDIERNDYASKGVAGTGLGLGIAGTALGLLNGGLGGLGGLGGFGTNAMAAAAIPAMAGYAAAQNSCSCNEDHTVNRYEAAQQARIAELETEVKLRDANTYTDNKMLEMYQYVDGRMRGVEGQISQQAVYNATNTAALNCMQNQINQLLGLTKVVVPNSSICPGWGNVNVTPVTPAT